MAILLWSRFVLLAALAALVACYIRVLRAGN